ncbi:MAG: competence/damage-inducible protein A [Acidiphilium sp. 21-68-69]|nr:MAG: competence/damage-inducible protein A [Acidiphilium sp. 21-68-69]
MIRETCMPSNPTAAILIIGNEILSGRTQDVNTKFIAGRLAVLGHRLEEVRVVPDIAERIVRAVNELRAAYDNLFTTGGIGPTHDDITSECIAAAFGVPWEKHQESWDALERHLGREQFNEARQRMAMLPRGAVPIPNSIAARLSAIQARYPQIDVGSYPFYREAGSGVAVVVKGTDVEALDAAAGEAESLIAAEGITPVQGEPPV